MSDKPIKEGKGIMWHIHNDPSHKTVYKPDEFTQEKLNKALEEMISTYKKSDHYEFAMNAYCETRGPLIISSLNIPDPCGDPECGICNMFNNLFPYEDS